jgi:hypothetical protein
VIPVFEGLLSQPHNNIVLNLLFILATWHSFAKLRLHTEMTLNLLDATMMELGSILRKFVKSTCSAIKTKELPSEKAGRARREAASAAKRQEGVTGKNHCRDRSSAQEKVFNLNTYKLHALGDYVASIKLFGTTDNYSTQVVRLPAFFILESII